MGNLMVRGPIYPMRIQSGSQEIAFCGYYASATCEHIGLQVPESTHSILCSCHHLTFVVCGWVSETMDVDQAKRVPAPVGMV